MKAIKDINGFFVDLLDGRARTMVEPQLHTWLDNPSGESLGGLEQVAHAPLPR